MHAEKVKLDKKDRRILYALWKDCRRSLGEISSEVGVSKQALHYRIGRLVENGIISAFITVVNLAKLGMLNHEVWLQFKSVPVQQRNKFISYLVAHDNVRLVAECGGTFDLLIGFLAANPVEFNEIFTDLVRKFPNTVKNHVILISTEFYAYPPAHLLAKEERKKPQIIAGAPQKAKLDAKDLKILLFLANNARISTVELAKKVDATAATVSSRIKRMEEIGVIGGYTIQFEHAKIGYENYEILASLHDMDQKKEAELDEYCRANQASTYLIKCIGRWSLDIGFITASNSHFQEILNEFRDRFSDVIDDYDFVSINNWRKFTYYPFKDEA